MCAHVRTWSSSLGLDTKLTTMLFNIITIMKSEKVKTGCNLAASSKEGYGSKVAVLSMMMMVVVVVLYMTEKWAFKVTVT